MYIEKYKLFFYQESDRLYLLDFIFYFFLNLVYFIVFIEEYMIVIRNFKCLLI